MTNIRIRSAVLALLFGNIGLDMLLLKAEQVKLFLMLGGPLLTAVVVSIAMASAQQGQVWVILAIGCGGLLSLWSLARAAEYLTLTDQQFANRLNAWE